MFYHSFKKYPDILTVRQMQDALQIGRTYAYQLLAEKRVRYFRIGRVIRIPKESLIDFIEREAL